MQALQTTRQAGFDNAKFLLIALVSLGHFCRVVVVSDGSWAMRSLFLFIYAFHMPLFFFISGLFARRDRINWRKVAALVLIGYLLKLFIFAVKLLMGQSAVFDPFSDTGAPWYLFSFAAILALNYLLRRLDLKLVFVLSLLAALAAGYFDAIANFLYLSRTLVFFPVFLAGQMVNRQGLMDLLHRGPVRALSGTVLALWAVLCGVFPSALWPWVRIFTARFPYSQVSLPHGAPARLGWYAGAALLCLAVLSVVPNRPVPVLTRLGSRTMQIYFWHRPALYVLEYAGISGWLWDGGLVGQAAYLAIGVGFAFLFGLNPFGFPTEFILKLKKRRT